MTNDRRLIEDFIPIREISAQAAREKSIRKGHISTLHLWWARRPLVAARAAVFASLVAAPETYQKRTALTQIMIDLCKWEAGEVTIKDARKRILEAQRDRLNLPANTPLNQVPPPKVLDMFAGGGAIPLEALRLGCETYAIDLNPVAHIIELCTLVYPQKYGKKLADEVEKWGNWIIGKVREEIGDLYPYIQPETQDKDLAEETEIANQPKSKKRSSSKKQKEETPIQGVLDLGFDFTNSPGKTGLTPVAYLWTRTVKCPNPACGATVPLVRQTWLCKKAKKYVALKVIPNHETKKVEFEVVEAATEKALGFDPAAGSSRGNSTCRHCGTTVDVKYVKEQGQAGKIGQQLMSIVCTTPGTEGKTYLAGKQYNQYIPDEVEFKNRIDKLCNDTGLTIPNEPLPDYGVLGFRVQPYGLLKWADLFTSRQLLSLMTFVKWVKLAHKEMLDKGYEEELGKAICTYLGLGVGKVVDRLSALGVWYTGGEKLQSPVASGRLPMTWDFPEANPLEGGSGSWENGMAYLIPALQELCKISNYSSNVKRSSSSQKNFSEESCFDAVITDPPYYDNVPYSYLSDYFYVWFKRCLGYLYPEHFSGLTTPKKAEAIVEPSRFEGNTLKAREDYENKMFLALYEANRLLKNNGILVTVYAHKTTAGWATLVDALRRAKFTITEAWPLDTEQQGGLRSLRASLASSIFLVARKRTNSEIGDYAIEVRPKLTEIVKERVKTLIAEGVTGADLVIACIGAGLRAYTQYERVELPNGDELDASSFLDEVQKEVLETVLTEVLLCDKKGVSLVDKPTQYYILGRYEYGEAIVDFDEANTLARGIGIELDGVGGLTDGKLSLVKKTKNQVQLRDYTERGADENLGIQKTEKQQTFNVKPQAIGAAPTLIDILHRLLWLMENKPQDIANFLALSMPDATQLNLVANALAGRALTTTPGETEITITNRTPEQQAIDTLLASWKRLIEDNLFTQRS